MSINCNFAIVSRSCDEEGKPKPPPISVFAYAGNSVYLITSTARPAVKVEVPSTATT